MLKIRLLIRKIAKVMVKMADDYQVLYILCRTDMESLRNPGLLAAQACHAANAAVHECGTHEHRAAMSFWQLETSQGFGTTITLDVDYQTMKDVVATCQLYGAHAGIILDPTYPLRDGSYTHLIPVETCGYVFGSKKTLEPFLKDLSLVR
jgi:predicted transcriptional regulator